MLKRLTDKNFKKEISKSSKPVLVEIAAKWSGSCLIMESILTQLAYEYQDKILVGKLDIDTNTKIASEYGVEKLPTYLFFKDGQSVDFIKGIVSKNELKKKIIEVI